MARLLVCGLCPLPFENTIQSYGPGIRTWQMAYSLAKAGHEVHLLAMRIPGTYQAGDSDGAEVRDGVHIERVSDAEFFDPGVLATRLARIEPEAVVGATMYGSHILAKSEPKVPFWADQFGHVMAEAQAKAFLEKANWPLAHFWNLLQPILMRCDRMSVVSERQRWAAVGELGLVGRLTHQNCGFELTSEMPCALVPTDSPEVKPVLRGSVIPDDAFIVLWSGGYNVWSDVDTLFQALESAMEKEPRIHFVSTGGEIGGHDETTYRRFEEHIAASQFRERFHLQGWVRAELVPSYQAEADVGVLSEIPMYEGQLGSKNRIVQWMGCGLPVVYNRVGDLGNLLSRRELGLTFAVGDASGMADQILWAAQHPGELQETASRAESYTREELSFEATTRDLVEWAASPSYAPDWRIRGRYTGPADFPPAGTPDPPEDQADSNTALGAPATGSPATGSPATGSPATLSQTTGSPPAATAEEGSQGAAADGSSFDRASSTGGREAGGRETTSQERSVRGLLRRLLNGGQTARS